MSESDRIEYRRAYARAYYHRTRERRRTLALLHIVDPEKQREGRARYVAKRTAIIAAAKAVPCADCGESHAARAMDFHHESSDKEFNISSRRSVSLERFSREVAKCTVLCATCHRLRH